MEIDATPSLSWVNILNDAFYMDDKSPPRTFFTGTQGFFIPETVFYHVRGFFEVIPEPQGQIPGWIRICFLSYLKYGDDAYYDGTTAYDDEEDGALYLDDGLESVYGFEGVVLPGGKIVLGQYWDMANEEEDEEKCERGPSIYWEDSKEKDLGMQLDYFFSLFSSNA